MNDVLKIHEKDNVATCLRSIKKDDEIELGSSKIKALTDIPMYHKIAIAGISSGSHCYKYGEIIGTAIQDIAVGDHVHEHNVESTRGRGDLHNQ